MKRHGRVKERERVTQCECRGRGRREKKTNTDKESALWNIQNKCDNAESREEEGETTRNEQLDIVLFIYFGT